MKIDSPGSAFHGWDGWFTCMRRGCCMVKFYANLPSQPFRPEEVVPFGAVFPVIPTFSMQYIAGFTIPQSKPLLLPSVIGFTPDEILEAAQGDFLPTQWIDECLNVYIGLMANCKE